MKYITSKRLVNTLGGVGLISSFALAACTPYSDPANGKLPALGSTRTIVQVDRDALEVKNVRVVVRSFESGPAVTHLIIKLAKPMPAFFTTDSEQLKTWQVTTGQDSRQVVAAYTAQPYAVTQALNAASDTITLELKNEFLPTKHALAGATFTWNKQTLHNQWISDYPVQVFAPLYTVNSLLKYNYDIRFTTHLDLSVESDAQGNGRIVPELSQFTYHGTYNGYFQKADDIGENITLETTAYEPDSLAGGAKNPLIVWLHGQGEGGRNNEINILGTQTSALTYAPIQDYFTSHGQTGAYVLLVQAPTYWMDVGDGKQGAGDHDSRYTQALQAAIQSYVKRNTDIDLSRIYLGGDSNGGYMTVNILSQFPDFYAGAFAICEAMPYYQYKKDAQNNYLVNGEAGTFNYQISSTPYLSKQQLTNLNKTPLWFIVADNDSIVDPQNNTYAVYKALLAAGSTNTWLSSYPEVHGQQFNTTYMSHFSWIYALNNQVNGVQNNSVLAYLKQHGNLKGYDQAYYTSSQATQLNAAIKLAPLKQWAKATANQQVLPTGVPGPVQSYTTRESKGYPSYKGGEFQAYSNGTYYNNLWAWLAAQRKVK